MALRIEHMERILFTHNKPQCIKIDTSRSHLMLPAQINNKMIVDENPHVVVTGKFQMLARAILERRLNFHREAEIMYSAITAANLIKEGIFNSSCRVEILEIIEQEQPTFRTCFVFSSNPKTV